MFITSILANDDTVDGNQPNPWLGMLPKRTWTAHKKVSTWDTSFENKTHINPKLALGEHTIWLRSLSWKFGFQLLTVTISSNVPWRMISSPALDSLVKIRTEKRGAAWRLVTWLFLFDPLKKHENCSFEPLKPTKWFFFSYFLPNRPGRHSISQ